jgi:SHS2 domain-containing protein
MGVQSYDYFEHDADVGVIGRGRSATEAFESAARAMFAIMTDLTQVGHTLTVRIEFEESDVELALVTWLNRLLAEAREHGAVFSRFRLERRGDRWMGEASGEVWTPRMERGVEVKGATLTMLSVREQDGQWEARCVVDV